MMVVDGKKILSWKFIKYFLKFKRTVWLRRTSVSAGNLEFHRGWTDYVNGFSGNILNGEELNFIKNYI